MVTRQPLDDLPIVVVVVGFAFLILALYEIGFRLGRWIQSRDPEERSGPTPVLVGSLLALMAFLLAIAMGMASDRYNTRRGLVLAEANSIGTTYLRAGYLPEPAATEMQDLLRQYVPLRITAGLDEEQLLANIARSEEIHGEMWAIAEDLARENPDSDTLAIFIESLNETIDLHASRITAGVYARVPATVLWLLIGGVALSLAMVGYNAGLTGKRSPITAVVLVFALGTVTALVIDLDRPSDGLIQTGQQPLIDFRDSLEQP